MFFSFNLKSELISKLLHQDSCYSIEYKSNSNLCSISVVSSNMLGKKSEIAVFLHEW